MEELTGNTMFHELAGKRTIFNTSDMEITPEKLNARNQLLQTPLIVAVQHRHPVTVETLISLKPDLNCQDWNGDTALHHCVHKGERDYIQALLHNGANIEVYNNQGKTCIHIAAEAGNHLILRQIMLQSPGADIDICDGTGETALMLAVRRGQQRVIHEILKFRPNLDCRNPFGQTALHLAVATWDIPLLKTILFVTPKDVKDYDGKTPLATAAELGIGVVFHNIQQFATDLYTVDNYGNSILHLTCRAPDTRILRHLLQQHRFPLTLTNKMGQSPLHFACEVGNLQAILELTSRFAALNEPDHLGHTPLHTAIYSGHEDVAKQLLSTIYPNGSVVDKNAQDCCGNTPLHACVMIDNVALVQLLLEKRANKHILNNNGHSIMTLIPESQRESYQVYNFLEQTYDSVKATEEIIEESQIAISVANKVLEDQ